MSSAHQPQIPRSPLPTIALLSALLCPGIGCGAASPVVEAPPRRVELPADAPKAVRFGVIVVTYKGAQRAPADARSRTEALELAKELATEAKKDFGATVSKGDSGSTEDAGEMPQGILEPAPEVVLFSLAKGQVSDPVETPTGFWILRRRE